MSVASVRFCVGDPSGARSSQWLLAWKARTADVYLLGRTAGGTFKASLHASGQCHIRARQPSVWCGDGPAPMFVDTWTLDTGAVYTHAFGLMFPTSELRIGPWEAHRKRDVSWVPAAPSDETTEIALFFTRKEPRPDFAELAHAGWPCVVAVDRLYDGRDLWLVAGNAPYPAEARSEILLQRQHARAREEQCGENFAHPRIILVARDVNGIRRFVEAAGRDEA